MKCSKYGCAVLAALYLAVTVFPADLIVGPHSTSPAAIPAWVGRMISAIEFLALAVISYGLFSRKSIYWILIPFLIALYLMSVLIPALWTLIELSLPWRPFMFIVGFLLLGFGTFGAWWRKQRDYFA